MSLADVLDAARRRRKTLVVHGPVEDGEEIAQRLDSRNVRVTVRERDADAPEPYVAVYDDTVFRAAVGLGEFRAFLEPPVDDPGEDTAAARDVHELLDDSVFASLSRRQLLATAREIEDRAYRTGRGELHAGFQSRDAFADQRDLYADLGATSGLDVHAYVVPAGSDDTPVSAPSTVTVHETPHTDVGRYWFVVFDGGHTGQECALVAEQRGSDEYYGAWTYDPALVAEALAAVDDIASQQSA
jgi:hypothetical protein